MNGSGVRAQTTSSTRLRNSAQVSGDATGTATMLFAGLRCAETVSLRPRDVDLSGYLIRARGKGNKERVVPVNDRARDAVRGIGPFDSGQGLLDKQGFANGMFYDPKASVPGTPTEQLGRLLLQTDQIKVGMAGNLKNFEFVDRNGNLVTGDEVDYNGSPAGYNLDPQEDISYIEAHDNQTLFDINVYAAPQNTSMADRARMQIVGLSTIVLGQGVPFIHAGSDMLRSKSLDHNSYNSGDWFNTLDWTGADNGFGHGLPPKPDNEAKWSFMKPLLANPALKPSATEVATASAAAEDLLKLRFSTPLFRLGSAALILSSLPNVRAAFGTRDRATIRDSAAVLWGKISETLKEAAFFFVTDPAGQTIASLDDRSP